MSSTQPSGTHSESRLALLRLLKESRTSVLAYISRQIPQGLRHLLDAEDIFQGVCYRASSQITSISIPEEPDAAMRWLLSVARNFLIDRVRELRALKRGASQLTHEDVRHGSVVAMLQDLALYSRTPSASAAAHEFFWILQEALEKLTPEQRSAVRFRYIDGLSLAEAAARMRRTEDAVRKLSERGLASLRVLLRTVSMYV